MGHIYSDLFAELSTNLELFVQAVKGKKSTLMATSKWSVKDVLCHIVFWHERYAANYRALANHREPPLPEGPLYKLNMDGVASLRGNPIAVLMKRLRIANKSLFDSIVNKKVPRMTYKKNGRVYRTEDFLRLIARHLVTHTKQVRRAR